MLMPLTPRLQAMLGVLLVMAVVVATARDTAWAQNTPKPPIVVPDSVDPTGDTDVTDQLQNLFDRVREGQTIRFAPGATYRVEGTLTLNYGRWVTIDGNGATLMATTRGDRNRSHLRIRGGNDISVHDLTIVGAHPTPGADGDGYVAELEAQMGIDLLGVKRADIRSVDVRDVYGDFVYVGRGHDGRWSEAIWIRDNRFDGNGRQGVAVTAGRDIVIERNLIRNVARAAVDLEPNTETWGADNVHILQNTIGTGRLLFLAAHGNGPVNNVVVADNRIVDRRKFNISVQAPTGTRRSGFWILNNETISGTPEMNLNFRRVDNIVIADNTIDVTEDPPEITMPSSCGTATGNDFGELDAVLDVSACSDLRVEPPPRPAVGVTRQPEPLAAATIAPSETTIAPPPSTSVATTTTATSDSSSPVVIDLADPEPNKPTWRRAAVPTATIVASAALAAFGYRRRRANAPT